MKTLGRTISDCCLEEDRCHAYCDVLNFMGWFPVISFNFVIRRILILFRETDCQLSNFTNGACVFGSDELPDLRGVETCITLTSEQVVPGWYTQRARNFSVSIPTFTDHPSIIPSLPSNRDMVPTNVWSTMVFTIPHWKCTVKIGIFYNNFSWMSTISHFVV